MGALWMTDKKIIHGMDLSQHGDQLQGDELSKI